MISDEELVSREKINEGFVATPQPCPSGYMTIGYGHNLENGSMGKAATNNYLGVDIGNGISEEQATQLLKHDLDAVKSDIMNDKRLGPLFQKLDDERQYVLLDLCFNMGPRKVKEFNKMLTALENGDYERASKELLNSRYARQTGDRARKNAECLRTGEWSDRTSDNYSIKQQLKQDVANFKKYEEKKIQQIHESQISITALTEAEKKLLRPVSIPSSYQNISISDKDRQQMRSMLNNLNRSNGKKNQVNVEETVDSLVRQFGNDAAKVLTKIMMAPAQIAKKLDLKDESGRPLVSSYKIINHLCNRGDEDQNRQVLSMVVVNQRRGGRY